MAKFCVENDMQMEFKNTTKKTKIGHAGYQINSHIIFLVGGKMGFRVFLKTNTNSLMVS